MAAEEMEVPLDPLSQDASTQRWIKEEPAEETHNCWSPLGLIKVEQGFLLPHECPQTERDVANSLVGEPPAGGQWSSREQRMLVLPSPPREIQLASPDPRSATSQVHESLGSYGASRPVKEEVLSPEGQRQLFRGFLFHEAKEPKEVYQRLSGLCRRWLQPKRSTKEQMLELVVLEQFVAILPPGLQGWVRSGEPDTCLQAVALAEEFLRRPEQLFSEVSSNLAEGPSDLLDTSPQQLYNQPTQEDTMDVGIMAGCLQDVGERNPCVELADPVEHQGLDAENPSSCQPSGEISVNQPETKQQEGDAVPSWRNDSCKRKDGVRRGKEPNLHPLDGKSLSWIPDSISPKRKQPGKKGHKGLGYILRSSLVTHRGLIQTTGKLHSCSYGGQKGGESSGFGLPFKSHSREKPYRCSECGKRFQHPSGFNSHLRSHREEKLPQDVCKGKSISTHSDPRRAGLSPAAEKCGTSFCQNSQLLAHQRVRSGEQPFRCFECGKIFSSSAHLNGHQCVHMHVKALICSDCGKTFSGKSHLSRHQRIHTGENLFKCPECGKNFCVTSDLAAHMRIHTGHKPYKCLDCGKSFTQKQHLTSHRRTHTGEKPYVCAHCGKGFSVSSNLNTHERTHTGVRPFQCSECEKRFKQKSHLIVHQRHHTGERPYLCVDCGKGFGSSSNLVAHMWTHIGDKV
ncbi:zinc finger protein with KRAB and SCAN domains 8-like isoform X2 [Crotalus tigris]|uniref:zinc finger protein with KRAB and SCAN domains 8-like isoform X2 n=1 Tax=Crotalus tigris TaxID=88082 RepID=UPI00192F7F06|nr:zinc finger protein with KRAB and SCAN domains 8-like isoform X2 [Crotalus tigris]